MKHYRKKGHQAMTPWHKDMNMDGVSVSDADFANGSPRDGDMISVNEADPTDRQLVTKAWLEVMSEEG